MRRLITAATAALLFAITSPAGFAVEADQVRGEIVEVNAKDREIRVRIAESGESRTAKPGEVKSFYVPQGTSIDYDLDRTRYSMHNRTDDSLASLAQGDTVLLNFQEVSNRQQANLIVSEEPRDPTLRDRVRRDGRAVARADESPRPGATGSGRTAGGSMMDRSERDMGARVARTELPASASPLPALALAGLVFAGLGAALRLRRRR